MSLVLASGSLSRREMLSAAGVAFEVQPAAVDERAIEAGLGDRSAEAVALALAEAKALAVSRLRPGALVLGSDSLVEVDGRRFDKPSSREDAADTLCGSSRAKRWRSTAPPRWPAMVWFVWSHGDACDAASARRFPKSFIESYLAAEWPAVAAASGCSGSRRWACNCSKAIEGSHFTVLGMPLLPVLGALREQTELAS